MTNPAIYGKKLTKVEIATMVFGQYGIQYKKEGNSEKIYNPLFGWINKPLIDGNSKIGKGVYHFSTLPTNRVYTVEINGMAFEILGTCPCHCVGCYATKGNYNFITTIEALAIRTLLARQDLTFLKNAIIAQIIIDNIQIIRVHASGDFFNSDYINMWREVAMLFPSVVMWTYTKNAEAEAAFDDITNFNVVKSVIPGKGFNFGHCDYILALYEYLKEAGKSVYICKCGIDKNQHCTNCHACAMFDYVLFLEHSTGYKAEKDPLFPVIKALIESQPDITKQSAAN